MPGNYASRYVRFKKASGICHMQGTAYVGNKVVMEAEMLAQIVKKDKIEKK